MKCSYECKRMCVELYREGGRPETPEGLKESNFRCRVRKWVRMEDSCGPEVFQHKEQNRIWTAEEKYELVAKVLAGASTKGTSIAAGVSESLLYQWVKRYRIEGYQGLVGRGKGRPAKEPQMKKKIEPAELTPSEREEMIRLKAEHERLRTENAVIKKRLP